MTGSHLIIRQTREGSSVGEYFGASLAVADVNNDMLDDLLVGAPRFSSKGDEGSVYVFMGNKNVSVKLILWTMK